MTTETLVKTKCAGARVCAALALTAWIVPHALAASPSQPGTAATTDAMTIDPGAFPAIGHVDERFQSYNVEMAEVIGGRFWKPYAHMKDGAPAPAAFELGKGEERFEKRDPLDLTDHRLRALAAALGPAYVRVSGSWANSVYFQDNDQPPLEAPPAGFDAVLTRQQWHGVVDFAKAVDAKIVTSFPLTAGTRDDQGVWTPAQARALIDYTKSIGGQIYSAELFNEPNIAEYGGAPKGYNARSFAADMKVFRSFAAKSAPELKIVGPGDVVTFGSLDQLRPMAEDLFTAQPRPHYDIISYHFYGALSPRCAPPDGPRGMSADKALTEQWLARPDEVFDLHKSLRDRYAPGAPIWITETADAACGGTPWASTFLDSFRYLDQLARHAKRGVNVVFHNTLAASDYGLIDDKTHAPRPNYWAALLWRDLMGTTVLDAGPLRDGFHLYAHCLRDKPGGVGLLAINTRNREVALNLPSRRAKLYSLTADTLQGTDVRLNGHSLALDKHDRIPPLKSRRIKDGKARLAPRSISFIALPSANNGSCR